MGQQHLLLINTSNCQFTQSNRTHWNVCIWSIYGEMQDKALVTVLQSRHSWPW